MNKEYHLIKEQTSDARDGIISDISRSIYGYVIEYKLETKTEYSWLMYTNRIYTSEMEAMNNLKLVTKYEARLRTLYYD